jgi:hypothetical protein
MCIAYTPGTWNSVICDLSVIGIARFAIYCYIESSTVGAALGEETEAGFSR